MRAQAPTQVSLHLLCDVHKVSAVAKKAFDICPKIITECISLALALRSPGIMTRKRKCLGELIQERMQRKEGHASYDAEGYRQFVFEICLATLAPHVVTLRALVQEMVNGDILQNDVIIHYCRVCCATHQGCVRKFKTHLVKGFLGRRLPVFPRSTWVGADSTFDSIGAFMSIHGLCQATFLRAFGMTLPQQPTAPSATITIQVDPDVAEDDGGGAGRRAGQEASGGASEDLSEQWRKALNEAKCKAVAFLTHRDSLRDLTIARRQLRPQPIYMKR